MAIFLYMHRQGGESSNRTVDSPVFLSRECDTRFSSSRVLYHTNTSIICIIFTTPSSLLRLLLSPCLVSGVWCNCAARGRDSILLDCYGSARSNPSSEPRADLVREKLKPDWNRRLQLLVDPILRRAALEVPRRGVLAENDFDGGGGECSNRPLATSIAVLWKPIF
ncbi:uncharacterized protein P174DRAFT_247859 [Aspergillus novofumigatus IBT 16806]|uniref:Uncharacterized protein n=1 Tax=Aspergillus novofumigatus (strain IBT 16806) TaxID=1392255 RepID=A0A2I1C2B1_ASPN1|nr:uncharacterized protein P174DRAFT_247859 [Aspergillus novofumigatus IBT 16806]PKX91733.1 hypothetical protein P174DRAFT_247859 [Aspergillus novofumigatus IBT 16806]